MYNNILCFQISERKSIELEKDQILLDLQEEKKEQDNMDFQLNPEAAEFVPLSPPLLARGFLQDFAISGSPLKQTQVMDDILIPSQSEFDKEVCYRPKEIGEEFAHEHADPQNNSSQSMDISEISSTKAEMGDDESSMMHVMSTSQWQTNISSQWNEKTGDDAGSDLEEGDIVTKNNLMSMSILSSGNLKTTFEKSVDLNAVHMLDDSSDDADQVSTPPHSPEPYANNDRAHTPLSEDKSPIDVLRASTPQPSDENSMSTLSSEISSEMKASSLSATIHEKEKLVLDHEMHLPSQEFTSLAKKVIHNMPGIDIEGHYTSSDESQMKDNCSTQKSTEEICEENKKFTEDKEEEKEKLSKIEDDKDISSIMKSAAQSLQNCSQIMEKDSMESEVPQNLPDSTNLSNFNDATHVTKHILQQSLLEQMHPEPASDVDTEQISHHANFDSKIIPEKMDVFIGTPFKIENNQSNQSTNWMDCYKTDNSIVQLKNVDPEFEDGSHFENRKQKEFESDKDKDDKDDNIKPDSTTELHSSDSQKFSFVEDELQYKQMFVEPIESRILIDKPTEQEQAEEKVAEFALVDEVLKEKVAFEDIPSKERENKSEIATALPEDNAIIGELKEVREIAEMGTVVAATVAAVAIANSIKPKTATTTSAKRPTKTMTTKATTASTTKTVTKSTPTSPSKTISAAMRAIATSPAQSIAKKSATSTATRPKQLDGSAKVAISSANGKTTVTKTPPSKTMTITTATRTSASPRVGSGTTRPKTTTTISSKVNSGTPTEKKSMMSGDAKSIGKSATTKPTSTTLKTTATAKTTLVKASSTTAKTSVSSVTSKSRAASATSAAKSTSTSKQSATGVNGASRPRTAPISSGTSKLRESSGRTATTVKSPLIDKQSKETVNKQISRFGASTPKASGRASVGTVTGVTKTRAPISGKSAGNAAAISPTKKTPTSKTTSRTSTATKRLSSSEAKVLQNGIPKEDVTKAAVITATSKPEDDVPRKDPSPVNVPADNQLIAD